MNRFTDSELEFHTEMRSLARTPAGEPVLIGLTEEETDFYLAYIRGRHEDVSSEDVNRYLELHDKHECRRLAVLFAEVEARNLRGPKH